MTSEITFKMFDRCKSFDKRNKEYKDVMLLIKKFWCELARIDQFKLLQVTENFEKDYYKFIKMLFKVNYGLLTVAYKDNIPIGFALGYVWNKPCDLVSLQKETIRAELYDLFVDEPYRNQDVGSTLARITERYYKNLGCTHFVVGLLESNYGAYRLYKRLGFKDNVLELMKELK